MNQLFSYLQDSLRFFLNRWLSICAVLFPVLIPLQLAYLLAVSFTGEQSQLALFIFSFSLVIYPLYQGALVSFVDASIQGHEHSVTSHYQRAMLFWLPMLLMYGVYLALTMAGLMLLVLPGLIVIARFSYSEFFCLLHQQTPVEALRSSWHASRDDWGMLLVGTVLIWALTTLPVVWIQHSYETLLKDNIIAGFILTMVASIVVTPLTIFRYRAYSALASKHGG